MAAINDLINQIEDKELRTRIEQELNKLTKQKKFGLVFEEHFTDLHHLFVGSGITIDAGKLILKACCLCVVIALLHL